MRDEGVIYVAGHPLLNRRCTSLPGCIRLRNDLYCVEWGVKIYSLTHCVTTSGPGTNSVLCVKFNKEWKTIFAHPSI